jgi:HAD superfamily hydrolase (TIGR01509 family)
VGLLEDDPFFEAWAHALGGRFDPAEARLISEAWLLGEYEGVAQTVEKLHARGFRLGCLSNTCNHHWNHMLQQPDQFPTLSLLTDRHASHLFRCMKPDPRTFALFEQAVGVSGDGIVYFDDVAANTDAALERGWRAFRILPDRSPAGQIEQALSDLGLL